MGQESSGGNQWKDAVGRYEKADPAEFSLHYRLYMVEKAAWLYRHCNGDTIVDRLMVLL